MPAQLLLHPFSILVSGAVATAEQGTEEYLTSQIQVVIGTRIGERQMCPPFGVPDPAYGRLSAADIQTCVDRFGPDHLLITNVRTSKTTEFEDLAEITWETR